MKYYAFLILVLTCMSAGYCQDATSSFENPTRLPGHWKKAEDLVGAADVSDVFLGTFIDLGRPVASDSPGEDYYDYAKVKIIQSYRGKTRGTLQRATYSVFSFWTSHTDAESAPTMGVKYIIFIQHATNTIDNIIAIRPASPGNVTYLESLLIDTYLESLLRDNSGSKK